MAYKPSKIPKLSKLTKLAAQIMPKAIDDAAQKFVNDARDEFVQRIKDQDFASFQEVPLSKAWVQRKLLAGADTRVMIATGTYVDSIRVFRRKTKRGYEYRIGIHKNKRARDLEGNVTDMPMIHVAMIQEYGSQDAHVPARPHWRPYREEMAADLPLAVEQAVTRALRDIRRKLK